MPTGSSQADGTNVSAQAASSSQSANAQAATSDAQAATTDTQDQIPLTPEAAAELRREAQKLRQRLRERDDKDKLAEAERQAAAIAQADADGVRKEYAKAQEALTAAHATLAQERQERAIENAARAKGVQERELPALLRLVDPSAIEKDADGKPTNVAQVVADTIKAYPTLLTARPTGGNANAGSRSAGQPTNSDAEMNALLRKAWRG